MTPTEIVALPNGAGLDALAAAKCILLEHPGAVVVKPLWLAPNAWEYTLNNETVPMTSFTEIDFDQIKVVYLVDIIYSKHSPEVVNIISSKNIASVIYSQRKAKLPFKPEHKKLGSLSLTSALVAGLRLRNFMFTKEDMQLFWMAITEKTRSGLATESTEIDIDTLCFLGRYNLPVADLSNSLVIGLSKAQKELYNNMLKSVEYLGENSLTGLVIVENKLNVFDVEPLADAVWSDLSVPNLFILFSYKTTAAVWARSSSSYKNYFDLFRLFRPTRNRSWVNFTIKKTGFQNQKTFFTKLVTERAARERCASDFMAVSPVCVESGESVTTSLNLMLKYNIMSLVVLSNGKFDGIIARTDIDRAMQMQLPDAETGEFSNKNVPVVSPETPLSTIRKLMTLRNVMKLPVVDGEKVIGLITSRELLRAIDNDMSVCRLSDEIELPNRKQLLSYLKRVFPLKFIHLLTKIGKISKEQNLKAYIVGGFVRDLLLEKKNLDLDIVILGDAISFAEYISEKLDCDFKVFDRFHTARIYVDEMKIDFSSARIEHYSTPGALPKVEFSGLANDLNRRDFSVNALALSLMPENFLELEDFFGGYFDLKNKSLRILNQLSFIEDPTRLFRAIRFMSRFNFEMEKDTRRSFDMAISKDVAAILSKKRIGAEISRSLNEEYPHKVVKLLFEEGLMKYLDPELVDTSVLPIRFRLVAGLIRRFKVLNEEIDAEAIYWTGLLSVLSTESVVPLLDAVGISHGRKKIITQSLSVLGEIQNKLAGIAEHDNLALYEALSEFYLETLISIIVFSLDRKNARKVLYFIGDVRGTKCQVSGKDMIEAGIPEGPHISVIFRKILVRKLSGEELTKEEELNYAIKLYENIQV